MRCAGALLLGRLMPAGATEMLPDAAALLRSALPITSRALIGAHPALHSVAAPLPSVFAHIPAEADLAACERALVWPAQGAGAGKPLLHVQLGASHTQVDCARTAAALARLQPKPSIALVNDARGLRVVAPLLQHLAALPVVSIMLLPSDEGADAQRDVLQKCAPCLRALQLRNVLSRGRADRLQRAVAPGPGFAHPALDETTRLLQLHCLALHDNVRCDCDCAAAALCASQSARAAAQLLVAQQSPQRSEEDCGRAGRMRGRAGQAICAAERPDRGHSHAARRGARPTLGAHSCSACAHAGPHAPVVRAHVLLAPRDELPSTLRHVRGQRWRARRLCARSAGLTLLRELDLSGVECASAGGGGANFMRELTPALPRLRHLRALHMSENELVAGHGVGALSQPACTIAAQLCKACAHLPALTCLALAQCGLKGAAPGATALFAALAGLTRLQWLNLSRNALCDASALMPLVRLQQLRHVGAHDCQLLRRDFGDLADALRALTAITRLDLRWNEQLAEQQLDACAGRLGLHNDAGDMRTAAQPQ